MSEKLTFKNLKSPNKTGLLGLKEPKNEEYDEKSDISDMILKKVYHLIENGDDIRSVREINKLKTLAAFSFRLVGDLALIEYFKKTDEVWKILNSPIKRSEKVKLIAVEKCITDRHARRIVEKFENGKDKTPNN